MNYCTPFPLAEGIRDYLVYSLNILHPPRVLAGNQLYSAVKLRIHSLPWVGDLKLQRLDSRDCTPKTHPAQLITCGSIIPFC